MPSAEQLRSRLLKKLSELFQLDQPDLDFGFYRIMHAKAQEVQDFISTDLLKIVADAFGDVDEARKAELQAAYEKAIETAKGFGVPNPEETEPVKKAKAALDAVKDTASAEADVYDHLYRFFERYYDDGDFISRRYYTRETPGKAAPFAIPYNGEEVKLHWATADQYYIKSAEYFSNFTFDLRKAKEIRSQPQQNQIDIPIDAEDDSPLKVHFRVIEATEGEHGNVKASEANKRFFIIHAENPVTLTETGELVVNFEYRPDPEKTGQEGSWRDKRNAEAVETILKALEEYDPQIAQMDVDEKSRKEICENLRKSADEYLRLFKVPAPTEKDKNRPLLAKYINQYTARNTMDYFIHKDLGGFLRRELDFYIKNEVMRLDDIENAEAPAVESYLAKIKVLRKIAGKLIDFLAQLEDFQKKLWLKKKFVVETNYCITLDRVPEELYAEVAACDAQREEWIKLFAIDEIQADLHNPGFTRPLTVEFLKANNKLVLDTRFFDDNFKARLVASIENFDEQCDGLLIHSENFQALNLLQENFKDQIHAVYIDPPYNTGPTEIIYKNEYKDSSWLSLMQDRLLLSQKLLRKHACYSIAIDDFEMPRLCETVDQIFPGYDRYMVVVNHHPQGGMSNNISRTHEYMLMMVPSGEDTLRGKAKSGETEYRSFMLSGPGNNKSRQGRPNSFYAILIDPKTNTIVGLEPPPGPREKYPTDNTSEGFVRRYPISPSGEEKVWCRAYDSAVIGLKKGEIVITDGGTIKLAVDTADKRHKLMSNWTHSRYNAGPHGTALVANMMGHREAFSYPKSIHTVVDSIEAMTWKYEDAVVLDFFAGSATTGQAIIDLNRADGGNRKYVLVEMGYYFDSVTKPRLQKSIYSDAWKNGKPTARHTGISHCFKYIRLESYEDTLNNLRFDDKPGKSPLLKNPSLKEDYMLRYLLDVETRGSQSLLNIDAFADPTAYTLEVKKPGTNEYVTRAVDLIETFNYLIGLRVVHYAAPQEFTAKFKRVEDPEVPKDQKTKLVLDGKIKQIDHCSLSTVNCSWWFRKVEGWVPADPANPNNGQREKVLVVWRKLTGDIEQDNLMLDEWFQKNRISTRDFEFDTIYVNGSNNLPNLKRDDENWKVRLIEEEFMKRMWNGENA
ncbi:MAG TPA: site-specific DNA-methyltransferase [Halothiobacillaceae bacterium]|nr:site-specific DNA-methyltransferase [Halothiobacillaceae bacterium]